MASLLGSIGMFLLLEKFRYSPLLLSLDSGIVQKHSEPSLKAWAFRHDDNSEASEDVVVLLPFSCIRLNVFTPWGHCADPTHTD